ncbi:Crp/Fnr family transcriptional regulator [Chloroflexota bacterium]|nr:Crp/Fnr family transcriptional regulator [Chloroflexota bacterium]
MNDPDLDNFPLFRQLSPETQRAIEARLIPRHISCGEILLIEKEPAEYGYFIRSGILRTIRTNSEGRIQVLARFSRPEPVNIISLLSNPQHNRATIDALSDVDLYAVSAADFDYLITKYPDFSTRLLKQLAGRIGNLTDKITNLSLFPVRTRLARFLLQLADSLHPNANGWTQDEIAAEIGTTRDIVGRILREFEQENLITKDHSEILLLDKTKLYQIAELPLP